MSGSGTSSVVVPLLVFEAAGCLMAIPASEVAHLEQRFREPSAGSHLVDLGEYFDGRPSDGPWLQWGRGTRHAWLRVRRVVDVVPVAIAGLTPMPARLRACERTRTFLAAGLRDRDVFLLLDPARLVT